MRNEEVVCSDLSHSFLNHKLCIRFCCVLHTIIYIANMIADDADSVFRVQEQWHRHLQLWQ